MPICIVALTETLEAKGLVQKLREASTPLRLCQLVQPLSMNLGPEPIDTAIKPLSLEGNYPPLEIVKIEAVKLLNPKLARQERQKNLALWLMPFGLLAGLTFTQMTGLNTFSKLGFGQLGEPVLGSLLGMFSGWIGSYAGAASVNDDNYDDLSSLRKLNEEGKWLLILETPIGIELPWQFVQEINPFQVIRLSDL